MKSFRLFKTVTLSVLFLILSVCAVMFAFNTTKVQATSPVFEMDLGAYVKLVDDGGLRMRVKMDETTKTEIDGENNELFFLLMNQEKFNAANGDFSNVDCKKIPADKSLIYYSQKDGCYYSNLLIYNIPENMRTEYLCVVAGKTVDGVTTFASYDSATQVCKTFYNAVNASLVDLGIAEILNVYTWLGTEEYPVFIESEEQFEAFVNLVNSEEIDASVIKSVELKKYIEYKDSIFTNENFDASVITCTDPSYIVINSKQEFIDTLNAFYAMKDNSASPVTIKLATDIEFTSSDAEIKPTSDTKFYGVIDGQGHAIKNMKINTKTGGNYAVGGGLFGSLYGEVKNLALINVTLDNGGMGGSAGVICGDLNTGAVISNVFISGNVINVGNNCGGVVCKMNGGTLKNCIAALETTNTKAYSSVLSITGTSGSLSSTCYAISSTYKYRAVQWGGTLYANDEAFLSAVTSLPAASGWNSYWTLTADSLKFGDEVVFDVNVIADITSQFVFSNKYVIIASNQAGAIGGTNVNDAFSDWGASLDYVDISAYQGKVLEITMRQSAYYGLAFYDANKAVVSKYMLNGGDATEQVVELEIPANATYVRTCYTYNSTTMPFKAVIKEKTTEDISSQFTFERYNLIIAHSGAGTIGVFKASYQYFADNVANENFVDISAYQGKTLKITVLKSEYYGLVFYDANEAVVSAYVHKEGSELEQVVELKIPENAKYIRTSYTYNSTMPFSAIVLLNK